MGKNFRPIKIYNMFLYTIGYTQKSAREFFERIKFFNIKILVDVRLFNKTQLAGFSKCDDLKYFLEKICGCEYSHCVDYAPTKKILTDYRNKKITWPNYEMQYKFLMDERKSVDDFLVRFYGIYDSACLLCAEPTPEFCHRRLFAEMIINSQPDIELQHL